MVIPRSFVDSGIQGVLSFAQQVLGGNVQGMASGGFSAPISSSFVPNNTNSGMQAELSEIKSLLNNLGYHLSKNTLDTKKTLERWNVEGMPKERDF
jgi:hypothetical protein